MTIEEAVAWYAGILCALLVPLILLLLKRKAEKTRNANIAAISESAGDQPTRQLIDWSAVLALRPHKMLTGDMWMKTVIAAFVALCAGVIVVVFVFPLGAGWAAAASFVTVALLVVLFLLLID